MAFDQGWSADRNSAIAGRGFNLPRVKKRTVGMLAKSQLIWLSGMKRPFFPRVLKLRLPVPNEIRSTRDGQCGRKEKAVDHHGIIKFEFMFGGIEDKTFVVLEKLDGDMLEMILCQVEFTDRGELAKCAHRLSESTMCGQTMKTEPVSGADYGIIQ
ncbi:hypothetical protein niasHT_000563 [Heterodera trifolii]|uniref:Uncharacterized protein n=1 Tax=Heterodera trifolii TaxID=157864 RepID=A0ABD2M4F6_9BILA